MSDKITGRYLSDRIYKLRAILRENADLVQEAENEIGRLVMLEAELKSLRADKEAAVKLVLDAGLSTGHADTVVQLIGEVLEQYESLRAEIAAKDKQIEALLKSNATARTTGG